MSVKRCMPDSKNLDSKITHKNKLTTFKIQNTFIIETSQHCNNNKIRISKTVEM